MVLLALSPVDILLAEVEVEVESLPPLPLVQAVLVEAVLVDQ
jgi:hypothetical protein